MSFPGVQQSVVRGSRSEVRVKASPPQCWSSVVGIGSGDIIDFHVLWNWPWHPADGKH